MAKRIVTKIGDIFCVEIDNQCKRFFQYIVNDMEMLNSSVIRAFKTHYPMDYNPVMEEIIRDEVEFFAHTILRFGIVYNAWYKVSKHPEIGNYDHVWFRTSRDYGDKVEISERWDVWHINEPFIYVGRLTEEYQHAERGEVIPYTEIVTRLTSGFYAYKYPGF